MLRTICFRLHPRRVARSKFHTAYYKFLGSTPQEWHEVSSILRTISLGSTPEELHEVSSILRTISLGSTPEELHEVSSILRTINF